MPTAVAVGMMPVTVPARATTWPPPGRLMFAVLTAAAAYELEATVLRHLADNLSTPLEGRAGVVAVA
ncbi:hypothetical protein [Nonomuraea sp. NPDC049625]|uniref:hypothetical protein n=1 Tax=Nonomuraea sp. NPDC049625 TaxID=3155775 RepID=UPI00342C2F13